MQFSDNYTEHYLKSLNYAVHSLTMYYMLLLAYEYFPRKQAQLVVFITLANTAVRREEAFLHNDSFMAFLCAVAVYKLAV